VQDRGNAAAVAELPSIEMTEIIEMAEGAGRIEPVLMGEHVDVPEKLKKPTSSLHFVSVQCL